MHGQLGTLLLEDIPYIKRTVFCSRFQLIKNLDVSIATKSLPLYLKPSIKIKIKQQPSNKSKENNLKSITEKKYQELKKTISIYLCTKQQKIKICPLLKIFKSRELRGGLDHRHELSNHGLAVLFLRLNTCLLSYIHPFQLEEIE